MYPHFKVELPMRFKLWFQTEEVFLLEDICTGRVEKLADQVLTLVEIRKKQASSITTLKRHSD